MTITRESLDQALRHIRLHLAEGASAADLSWTNLAHAVNIAAGHANDLGVLGHAYAAGQDLVFLLQALIDLPVAGVVESPRPVAGEPCNCEHENHGTDFMGKQVPLKGHLPMAVFAGSQRAEFVGAVCDDCARDCVAEYLGDQSAKSVDDPWSAESRLAVVLAELRSEMAGARYVALLGNADLLGTQAADELANDEIRARAEDRVARCQRLIALAGGAE